MIREWWVGLLLVGAASVGLAGEDTVVHATFTGHPQNGLFTGRPGQWDVLIRERGWVMKDGNTWKLWYTGYDIQKTPLTMHLGYATSADGVHWKRASETPIYDQHWVEDMMVVKHQGRYFMFAEGAKGTSQLLESDNGIDWMRIGELEIRQTDGSPLSPGPVGTPTVFVEGETWYLFYERYDAGIWVAQSRDRRVWTNIQDEPVIVPGPHNYDGRMIAMNQVLKLGDRYYAVMHGTGTPQKPRQWCTYFVQSQDLLHWTKLERGPVLPVEDNKSSGQLVFDGANWRLYTMHAQVDLWSPKADSKTLNPR